MSDQKISIYTEIKKKSNKYFSPCRYGFESLYSAANLSSAYFRRSVWKLPAVPALAETPKSARRGFVKLACAFKDWVKFMLLRLGDTKTTTTWKIIYISKHKAHVCLQGSNEIHAFAPEKHNKLQSICISYASQLWRSRVLARTA